MEQDIAIWKVIACAVQIAVNVLGSFLPIFYTDWFYVKNGITKFNCALAGVLMTTAVTQMLSDAEETHVIRSSVPVYHILFIVGFACTMALQWLVEGVKRQIHQKEALDIMMKEMDNIEMPTKFNSEGEIEIDYESHYQTEKQQQLGQSNMLTLFIVFGIEGLLTGMAIGIQRTSAAVITLSASAAATDWIESVLFSMSIAMTLCRDISYRKKAFKYAALYCVTAILTAIVPIIVFSCIPIRGNVMISSDVITCILAGSFVYIACIDILSKEIHESKLVGGYPGLKELSFKLLQFFFGSLFVNVIVFLQKS